LNCADGSTGGRGIAFTANLFLHRKKLYCGALKICYISLVVCAWSDQYRAGAVVILMRHDLVTRHDL
jgi:hypothetical protein